MDKLSQTRRNPSRETCETAIKRILMTEVLQNGGNLHFKSASDFMSYFESLYTPSDALTKQVQRAIKALDMPKDEKGYFIVNKTVNQFEQEKEITGAFEIANVKVNPMDNVETVFLSSAPHMRSYIIHLIQSSETFSGKYITMLETSDGIIIYTQNKSQLLILLNSLTI